MHKMLGYLPHRPHRPHRPFHRTRVLGVCVEIAACRYARAAIAAMHEELCMVYGCGAHTWLLLGFYYFDCAESSCLNCFWLCSCACAG